MSFMVRIPPWIIEIFMIKFKPGEQIPVISSIPNTNTATTQKLNMIHQPFVLYVLHTSYTSTPKEQRMTANEKNVVLASPNASLSFAREDM